MIDLCKPFLLYAPLRYNKLYAPLLYHLLGQPLAVVEEELEGCRGRRTLPHRLVCRLPPNGAFVSIS